MNARFGEETGVHLCLPGRTRTFDPMIKSHLLYQLSYGEFFVRGCKFTMFLNKSINFPVFLCPAG